MICLCICLPRKKGCVKLNRSVFSNWLDFSSTSWHNPRYNMKFRQNLIGFYYRSKQGRKFKSFPSIEARDAFCDRFKGLMRLVLEMRPKVGGWKLKLEKLNRFGYIYFGAGLLAWFELPFLSRLPRRLTIRPLRMPDPTIQARLEAHTATPCLRVSFKPRPLKVLVC